MMYRPTLVTTQMRAKMKIRTAAVVSAPTT